MIRFRDRLWSAFRQRPYTQGVTGTAFIDALALLWDADDEAASLSIRSSWILDPTCMADSLQRKGVERSLEKYPAETWEQFRTRLWTAWQDYAAAGSATNLLQQLVYLGFPVGSITIHYRTFESRPPANWWSQFWLVVTASPTWATVGPPPQWGSIVWGSFIWGITGLTDSQIVMLRRAVLKWKPSKWVCRSIVFDIPGQTRSEVSIQDYASRKL
jgi:hypothetical protein